MNQGSWKFLLFGVVVAVALSATALQADAQWWGGCCRPAAVGCCYTPCYTGCCGAYDGGWYLGWRPGPIRRFLFGPYRWYWGGGWYGNACCTPMSSCCVDSCYADSCGCTSAPKAAPSGTPTPAKKPAADLMPSEPTSPTTPPPAAPSPIEPKTSATSSDASGVLTVWVPYDAKVTINGLQTRSTGSRRQFVSYGLKPGFSYKYVVRAQVVRNGQLQEDTRTVTLTAGEITAVAFGFNATSQQVAAR
ncbi:MAG: TIGR03000 domain-containing protein [Planctomycetaceae bacterium]|nr:TIGR03000 domain-containing protein [Planctomycetaceae bacterium]